MMNATAVAPQMQVPDAVLRVVHAEFGYFMRLQRTRYTDHALSTEETVFTSEMVGPLDIQNGLPDSSTSPSASEWSELYRRMAQPLGDTTVNALWGLVSSVLAVLESGDVENVCASEGIRNWYWEYGVSDSDILERLGELDRLEWSTCTDEFVEGISTYFLEAAEGMFFAGRLTTAAAIIEGLTAMLRRGPTNPFSDEVESTFADVKRLLYVGFTSLDSHERWQRMANDLIYDAKRTLSCVGRSPASAVHERVAENLQLLCLDVLQISSGDAQLLRTRCLESGLSLLDYIVAICAVDQPFANLREVHYIFMDAMPTWESDPKSQWKYRIVGQLLASRCVEDVVYAMGTASDVAIEHFLWEPEGMFLPGESDNNNEDDDDDDTWQPNRVLPLNGSNASSRRIALACMAAHVADAVVPPGAMSVAHIERTLCRNRSLSAYVSLFWAHARAWKVAVTYMMYSPLLNPAEVYNVIVLAGQRVARDNAAYLRLSYVFCQLWDKECPHQVRLRALLKSRFPQSATVLKWMEAMDYYHRKAYRDVHRHIIVTRFHAGDCMMAVWLAVETQVTDPVQWELKRLLKSEMALQSDCIFKVGEAVHNSFISLDVCPTAELAHSLRLCATLSECRRAASGLSALQHLMHDVTPDAVHSFCATSTAVLNAATWCLKAIEKVLVSADACDYGLHPETTCALVNHASDTLLLVRAGMCQMTPSTRLGEVSSLTAHVAECMVPLLTKALAMARIQSSGGNDKLEKRAFVVAEKLMRAISTHL